jgi:hypothetical protein
MMAREVLLLQSNQLIATVVQLIRLHSCSTVRQQSPCLACEVGQPQQSVVTHMGSDRREIELCKQILNTIIL